MFYQHTATPTYFLKLLSVTKQSLGTVWPSKPERFTIWPFKKNTCLVTIVSDVEEIEQRTASSLEENLSPNPAEAPSPVSLLTRPRMCPRTLPEDWTFNNTFHQVRAHCVSNTVSSH